MQKLIVSLLLLGLAISSITEIDHITEGKDDWSGNPVMTGNGDYVVIYNMSTYQFEVYTTNDGTKTTTSALNSSDVITGLGTLNNSNKFYYLLKEDGSPRVLKVVEIPGFTEEEYDFSGSGSESDIPENPSNTAPNSDNTKIYFTSSTSIATVTLSTDAVEVTNVFNDSDCSLTDSASLDNGWLQPELDRFVVGGDLSYCVFTISTEAIVERTVTHDSDISNTSPFGTDYIALEDRDNKKLVIKDWTDDSDHFTYQWGSKSWAKYFWPSRDGSVLIAPFNNDGPLMVINASNTCQYVVSDFDVSDNNPSFTVNGSDLTVKDTEYLQIMSIETSSWSTFDGCSAGDTEASWEYSEKDNASESSTILQFTVLSVIAVLSLI